jgi:hypothetical protein
VTGASTVVAAVDTTPIIVAVIGAAGAVVAALLTTRWRREDAKHQRADQELGKRHQDERARLEMRHAAELRDIDLEYEEALSRTREAPKTLLVSYEERVRETRELLQDVRTAMAELGTASRELARQVDGPAEAPDLAAPHRLQCKALTDLLTTRAAKIDGDMLPKMKHGNDLLSAYNDTRGSYGDRLSAAEASNLRAIAVSARPELDSIIGLLSEYERV